MHKLDAIMITTRGVLMLKLRSFYEESTAGDWKDVVSFGKHKDHCYQYVKSENPNYTDWCNKQSTPRARSAGEADRLNKQICVRCLFPTRADSYIEP